MNVGELQKKLIAAARARTPDDRVPFAFEKRIMARLGSHNLADHWVAWTRGLWRAAVPCVAVAVLLGAWTVVTTLAAPGSNDLSQDFESTLLASVDQSDQAQ